MKKLKDLGKILSKNEQKKISGGYQGYMCCWIGTWNCSACVPGGYPSCSEKGSEPRAC